MNVERERKRGGGYYTETLLSRGPYSLQFPAIFRDFHRESIPPPPRSCYRPYLHLSESDLLQYLAAPRHNVILRIYISFISKPCRFDRLSLFFARAQKHLNADSMEKELGLKSFVKVRAREYVSILCAFEFHSSLFLSLFLPFSLSLRPDD